MHANMRTIAVSDVCGTTWPAPGSAGTHLAVSILEQHSVPACWMVDDVVCEDVE